MDYITRDSHERVDFATGSRRDTNAGKPRFDLIPLPALKRWAGLMARGAEKYGERNWELGQSMKRFEESALRHLYQYLEGDTVEDHLAAVLFNVGALMHHEEMIAAGRLPSELDDRVKSTSARPSLEQRVRELLALSWDQGGGKIRAINLVRERGLGLREAKQFVDRIVHEARPLVTGDLVVTGDDLYPYLVDGEAGWVTWYGADAVRRA